MNTTVVGKISAAAALESLKDTLNIESEALVACASRLDASFIKAMQIILACQGKVIVTGLGKSGHVARKIAATMASTGTPAFFLHPSEALHGDLGMVGPNDVVFTLAFGGETREVIEVAKFAKRQGVPIIALSGNPQSTLASLAHVCLNGAVTREACPLNLAPTSSSLLAMAIGDALAVALMRARGFVQNDFAKFHPEGSLGRRLATVSDYMRPLEERMMLKPEDSFEKVLEAVMSLNYGLAIVQNQDGSLYGIITDGDVRRTVAQFKAKAFELKAEYLATRQPKLIAAEAFAIDAVQMMEQKITALIVIAGADKSRAIGIIRMHDLLAAKVV